MTGLTTYTWEDLPRFVSSASSSVYARYKRWQVELCDLEQECYVWLYGAGEKRTKRWLANDPQQTTRIRRSLYGVAQQYAEQEKAAKLGYQTEDVAWYSATLVEALLPFAYDDTFDGHIQPEGESGGKSAGDPAEGGNALAMVLDLRRALHELTEDAFNLVEYPPGNPIYDSSLQNIVNWLGGPRPFVGRRKAISNSEAKAITSE